MSALADCGGVSVLGVSVCGPAPLGWAHVRFDDDLMVLYGKNGAGKTRLLASIRSALSGVIVQDHPAVVHFKVDPREFGASDEDWIVHLQEAAAQHVQELQSRSRSSRNSRHRMEALERDLAGEADAHRGVRIERHLMERNEEAFEDVAVDHEDLADNVAHAIRYYAKQQLITPSNAQDIAAPVSEAGFISAVATGTEQQPSWRVFGGIHPSMDLFGRFISDEHLRTEAGWTRKLLRVNDQEGPDAAVEMIENRDHLPLPPRFIYWEWQPLGFVEPDELVIGDEYYPWPDWAPFPLVPIGQIGRMPFNLIDDRVDNETLDRDTIDILFSGKGSKIDLADSSEIQLSDTFRQLHGELCSDVTGAYQQFAYTPTVPDGADTLTFDMGAIGDWMRGRPPRWALVTTSSQRTVPLQSLSKAQQRWARLAIELAVHGMSAADVPSLVLLDEPEEGMHRALQNNLPTALRETTRPFDTAFLCATHSPAMLNSVRHLNHVARGPGHAHVAPLTINASKVGDDLELATTVLEIDAADILQMVKCFILVEGEHDKIVLKGLFGNELDAADARILPMRGAKNAHTAVGADLLMNYTQANIVVVMDNVDAERITPIWQESIRLAEQGDTNAARTHLHELDRLDGDEPVWMRQALDIAIGRGNWARVRPAPLAAPDIICYLPANLFAEDETWPDLIGQWRQWRNEQKRQHIKGDKDIKHWLQRHKQSPNITKKQLEKWAQDMVPHDDLVNVARQAGADTDTWSAPLE